jgi:hypothetical protein
MLNILPGTCYRRQNWRCQTEQYREALASADDLGMMSIALKSVAALSNSDTGLFVIIPNLKETQHYGQTANQPWLPLDPPGLRDDPQARARGHPNPQDR